MYLIQKGILTVINVVHGLYVFDSAGNHYLACTIIFLYLAS